MADVAQAKGKGASGSRSHRGASPPAVARSSSAEPLSSSSSGKKPNKFKFLMTYMFGQCCASAQREHDMQERLYHLEQQANIVSSPPPFVPPRDPLALYDEACVAYEDDTASCPHGKSKATEEDEDYIEEEDDDNDDDGGDNGDQDDDEDYEDE